MNLFTGRIIGSSPDRRANKWELTCGKCGKSHIPTTTLLAKRWEQCPKCHNSEEVNYNALADLSEKPKPEPADL